MWHCKIQGCIIRDDVRNAKKQQNKNPIKLNFYSMQNQPFSDSKNQISVIRIEKRRDYAKIILCRVIIFMHRYKWLVLIWKCWFLTKYSWHHHWLQLLSSIWDDSQGIGRKQIRDGSARQFDLETETLFIGNMAIKYSWISKWKPVQGFLLYRQNIIRIMLRAPGLGFNHADHINSDIYASETASNCRWQFPVEIRPISEPCQHIRSNI